MQEPPEDSNDSDVQPASESSRKKVVRRVVRSKRDKVADEPTPPLKNEENSNIPGQPEPKASTVFRCLKCATTVPAASEKCPRCGTAYVREEISAEAEEAEIDAELALDDSFEDLSPLFEQDDLGCGYFDVDHGIVAYIEPRRESKDAVFECLNCRTIVEFEAEKCPFCKQPLKKIDDGIVEIVNGVIVGEDLDMEISKDVFCPICGDLLALDKGHCIVCETELVSPSEEILSSLCPVVPSSNLIFLHLDIEKGDLNYLSNSKETPSVETIAPPNDDSFNNDIEDWIDDPENDHAMNDKQDGLG